MHRHYACVHPEFGACWWVNSDKNLCSHCVELPDDPDVVKHHPEKRESLLKMINNLAGNAVSNH